MLIVNETTVGPKFDPVHIFSTYFYGILFKLPTSISVTQKTWYHEISTSKCCVSCTKLQDQLRSETRGKATPH